MSRMMERTETWWLYTMASFTPRDVKGIRYHEVVGEMRCRSQSKECLGAKGIATLQYDGDIMELRQTMDLISTSRYEGCWQNSKRYDC